MTLTADEVLQEFCAEVARAGSVWTMQRDKNVASFSAHDGERVLPFWSSRDRCIRYLSSTEELKAFSPLEVPWSILRRRWLEDNAVVEGELGINWADSEQQCSATAEEVISGVENAT